VVGGQTRRTVTVVDSDATVLLEAGPEVCAADFAAFIAGFEESLEDPVEVVVLAGSLPSGVPVDAYAQLTVRASERAVRTVVDAAGPALRAADAAHPHLAKPNALEAATLRTSAQIDPLDAVLAAGASNAIVSRGPDGLSAVLDGQRYRVTGPVFEGNPTGAGDALTAVLARGIASGRAWPEVLRDAAATAAAAAVLPYAGGFDPVVADQVRPQITVEKL
jgi:tagatose 6-phosphate kinase